MNVVSPGPTKTPMTEAASKEVIETLISLIPVGRMGKPEEIAAAVCFLASDESSFIAGAELCVDGGMTQVQAIAIVNHCTSFRYSRRAYTLGEEGLGCSARDWSNRALNWLYLLRCFDSECMGRH